MRLSAKNLTKKGLGSNYKNQFKKLQTVELGDRRASQNITSGMNIVN